MIALCVPFVNLIPVRITTVESDNFPLGELFIPRICYTLFFHSTVLWDIKKSLKNCLSLRGSKTSPNNSSFKSTVLISLLLNFNIYRYFKVLISCMKVWWVMKHLNLV